VYREYLGIHNAPAKRPSAALAQEHAVGKEEFIRIGQQYDGWRNGTLPRNTSYIFGIIAKFRD
jgi:hypothetical protein